MSTKSDDVSGGILTSAGDLFTDLVTSSSIPAPIRKNVFKALNQLCSAAIDIPVAYLEGIATEKRAETQSRVKLMTTSGDQIANQMNVNPEFANAAAKRYSQKIVREQVNLDKVSEIAVQQIHQDVIESASMSNEATEVPAMNEDWLNNFEKEASQKSTEEMQFLFGKILAGEIQRPSSFSIKTVKLLAELDNNAAILFRQLCSLCVSLKIGNTLIDVRVVSINGDAGSNSLQSYGLQFDNLNILHEYGLIIPDYNSYQDYQICIIKRNDQAILPFLYQNRKYVLSTSNERVSNQELRLSGVKLSRSGIELMNIIDIEPSESYTTALTEYFALQNLQMMEIEIIPA
ncbi:DUF2806 domain-containing protein [Chamaesiphon sp.]|uniref:DUF2806 domain-containing protein n=1 Tax=Chamaesiphon sp. TaxID=2814140 RepID=UPI003593E2D5